MTRRWKIRLLGTVQGIGFRPFVYRLAKRYDLDGFVLNDARGAEIEIQGDPSDVEAFFESFHSELPPLALISEENREEIPPRPERGFQIRKSEDSSDRLAFVTPDAHVCDDCLAEMRDPKDRRYRYPFINCTNCGPRFTIIRKVPYDRPNTTMDRFPLCDECRREYEDPLDRRFHAQPVACPRCGPEVWLASAEGEGLASADPIRDAAALLRRGEILAVKGLGGFHLAVEAERQEPVARLRKRKWREDKPFALMARDIETARKVVDLPAGARDLLESPARPIVLAPRRQDAPVAPAVAPALAELGVMLPYTPLHHLLLEEGPGLLVMTSGNPSAEPLAHRNESAVERLAGIADGFLLHDRPIHNPCDDSVVRWTDEGPQMVRRARGYAPRPIVPKGLPVDRSVLAVGPELKNTICVTRKGQMVCSQHLGDLTNVAAYRAFEAAVERMIDLLGVAPEAVACDLHPDYHSGRFARQKLGDLPVIEVQHHHAHLAASMVEHDLELGDRVCGVVWDGTGHGQDDLTWGGEFLLGGYRDFHRAAHTAPIALPGGDAAVRHPWRIALSALYGVGMRPEDVQLGDWLERQDPSHVRVLLQMLERGWRSPLSSGAGRLFDAAAAIIDLRSEVTDEIRYEAQAAIELEAASTGVEETSERDLLGWTFKAGVLDLRPALKDLVDLVRRGVEKEICAARFCDTAAAACAEVARSVARSGSASKVVLSGGCFLNKRLSRGVAERLRSSGLTPLVHQDLPPNDGAVSVGQAAVALAKLDSV